MRSWLGALIGLGIVLTFAGGAAADAPEAQPKPGVPDLPTVEVSPRPVYSVPDYEPPPRPVTLKGRDGKDMTPPGCTISRLTWKRSPTSMLS